MEAPAATQPPVEQTHYDLYPWPYTTSCTPTAPADDEPPPPPPLAAPATERQNSRARLSLRRSLSAASLLVRLEDVIDAARPLLHDPCATYRLQRDAPLLLAGPAADAEGANAGSADAMYASAFAHLLALCRTMAGGGSSTTITAAGPAVAASSSSSAAAQDEQPGQQSASILGVALQIVHGLLSARPRPQPPSPALPRHAAAFLAQCLLFSPLETIAGCRHLRLWPLLLGAVGLPSPSTGAAAATAFGSEGAWLHAQDLCLELLHWAFLAAQRPPTTNFLSSPTFEMGVVAGLLEAAVAGLEAKGAEGEHKDGHLPLLLMAFRACRWLDLLIREQDDPATAISASIPAFNEHGHRLLALLPRLLSRLPPSPSCAAAAPAAAAAPLVWPARHAALSLFASLVHVASLVESQLALTSWAAEALFGASPPTMEEEVTAEGGRQLGPVFAEVGRRESRPVALFVLTRALHITAQLAVSASASGGRGLDTAALGLYREYLGRWWACVSVEGGGDGAGDGEEAAIDMAGGLCVLLREHAAYSPLVVRFHQWALRRAGVFAAVDQVLEAAVTPALVNQCLALLTALVSDNAVNRSALAAAFLQQEQQEQQQQQQPRLLRLLLLQPAALADGFDTVRALVDLAVGGPFPMALIDPTAAVQAGRSDHKGGSIVIKSPGVLALLFRLLPHLPAELQVIIRLHLCAVDRRARLVHRAIQRLFPPLQVTVLRMLRALVSGGGGDGGNGHHLGDAAAAAGPSPSELNSEVHAVLLPLLLDTIPALPPCSAPQVGGWVDRQQELEMKTNPESIDFD